MVGNLINNVSVTSAGIFVSLLSPFHTLYAYIAALALVFLGLAVWRFRRTDIN